MKIVVIGPQFPDSFARNIVVTLQAMGHEVLSHPGTFGRHNRGRYAAALWEYAPKAFPSLTTLLHRDLLSKTAEFRPHAVLVTSDFFNPQMVRKLKKTAQAPVLCWYIDPIANLRGGRIFGCDYDAIFCKEPQLVETMTEKLEMPAHYLPEACNPLWHRPVSLTEHQLREYQCDVAAQGTLHPYRAKFFDGLLEFNARIWGNATSGMVESESKRLFQGRYIAEDDKAAAFAAAKIVVNAMNFAETRGVNNTLFEAAGCGAFQLCDQRPTLSEFFVPSQEVVTFRSRGELKEMIHHYLDREDERKRIGKRAAERAHRDHTYERRLRELFKIAHLD